MIDRQGGGRVEGKLFKNVEGSELVIMRQSSCEGKEKKKVRDVEAS